MDFDRLYYILEIIGTIAFASSGALVAIRKGMDIFGIIVIAVMTAVGGGVFRDIILGITPPTAFIKTVYTSVSIATAIVLILFFMHNNKFNNKQFMVMYVKVVSVFDAIGLAIFTINGISMAMRMGHGQNKFLLLFVGIVTGCGGGYMRDISSGFIPIIFTRNTIYAMASLVGGLSFLYLRPLIREPKAFLISVIIVILIRLLSIKYRWSLPNVNSDLLDGSVNN